MLPRIPGAVMAPSSGGVAHFVRSCAKARAVRDGVREGFCQTSTECGRLRRHLAAGPGIKDHPRQRPGSHEGPPRRPAMAAWPWKMSLELIRPEPARFCPASLCSLGLTPAHGFGTMLLSENLQAAHSRKGLAGSCGSTHWTMSRIFPGYTLKWNTEPSLVVVSPRRSETILRHPGCA